MEPVTDPGPLPSPIDSRGCAADGKEERAGGVSAPALSTMTLRRDFLAANGGRRAPMPAFILLVRDRRDGDPAMRVGFTVTKKIGNAVVRNRVKRRFRALARQHLPASGIRGADHVLIGRPDGMTRDFALLESDLVKALGRIANADPRTDARPPSASRRKPVKK